LKALRRRDPAKWFLVVEKIDKLVVATFRSLARSPDKAFKTQFIREVGEPV
jgi:hypothetical protein